VAAVTRAIVAVDRHAAAAYVRRHPDQIRRRCTPIGTDDAGRALYDLEADGGAAGHAQRRQRLTRT